MRSRAYIASLALLICTASALKAQAPAVSALPNAVPRVTEVAPQFSIHGLIKSGTTPMPGVTVTASHSLTGKKVITSTDADGSYSLVLPGKGKWVLRVEFPAFQVQTAEVVLTPTAPDGKSDFSLILLSRAPKSTESEPELAAGMNPATTSSNGIRAAQRLSVRSESSALDAGGGDTPLTGMPALASATNSADPSVSVSGQSGQTRDFGLNNMDDLRERIDEMRARGELPGGNAVFSGGGEGPGGGGPGGPGGGPMMIGGGPGGFNMRSFRNFNVNQPHGALYYTAGNSALDASPYALTGNSAQSPSYSSNRFGGMIGGTLKIPHIYDDGGKTMYFLNYTGNRSTSPYDGYATVPTGDERAGNFCATRPTLQLNVPGVGAMGCDISSALTAQSALPQVASAQKLLTFIPTANLDGLTQNYHYSGSTDSDNDNISLRLVHNFGGPMMMPGRMGGGGRRIRNNINFAFSYSDGQSQSSAILPILASTAHTNGLNLNAGWTAGRSKFTSNFRVSWNRNRTDLRGQFAGTTDVAGVAGINNAYGGVSSNPADWGVPGLVFTNYTGLTINDVGPRKQTDQVVSVNETLMLVKGKHNIRFGGDFRHMWTDLHSSPDPNGTFTFNGSTTGFDFADFLLGYAAAAKIQYNAVNYTFSTNGYDLFVQDDWRARGNFTVNAGVRYEFISPYSESNNRLVNLDPTSDFTSVTTVAPGQNGYPDSLVNPQHWNFAPRIGLAWKPMDKTVVRAGYSINYNLGQYRSIVQNLALQPPYSFSQTNSLLVANTCTHAVAESITFSSAFPTLPSSCITNTYGIDPNYRLGYVQMWNLNIQRELPKSLLLNVGYTGSKGTALDMLRYPNRQPDGLLDNGAQPYEWETAQGFSIMHALAVRVRKRMTNGFSAGGTYTYSKSIDNASSIGGSGAMVAQNDKDLAAERGLSSFDQRHKLSADWLYELPFGTGKHWLANNGWAQKVFGDWTLSSSITAGSGTPFTASVRGNSVDVASGTNGSLRASMVPGQSISIGNPSLTHWFNTAAFTIPASGTFGTAGRNTIIGPGSVVLNMSLMKNVVIKETRSLEFRADAQNFLNHANYSTIDTVVNSPTFGQVVGVGSMRKITVSSRFRF
ncbi:MAG TPA: TonB-dependent receptor [Candidatus Acidoferrales bacterium]|nr:TonB-dependent receptor [Candidatus Acidoferrales bacterium]